AVTWAANGVDLRDPLKPAPPADSQAITLPWVSVSETIVLLNEVFMCACPIGMFFFGLRRPGARFGAAGISARRALQARVPRPMHDVHSCLTVRAARSLLTRPLLAGDLHPLGALARARVGLRLLAAHRQSAAVAQTAVAGDLLQALDVL